MTLTDKIARVKTSGLKQLAPQEMVDIIKQLEAKLEIAREGLEFYAKDAWVSIATFPAPNRVDWSKAPINDDYGTKAKQTLSTINEGDV